MQNIPIRPLWATAVALGLLAATRPAFADRPILGPTTLDQPGAYSLRRPIATRGDAPVIVVASDDVTLDLSGFGLSGPGGKSSIGIHIEGRRNVRIRNGHLASFGTAVRIIGSHGVDVSDLVITGEDQPAAPPETGILALDSRGLRITGNTIGRTFLGIFVRGGGSGANTIKGNTLAGGENGQLGICYNPAPGADAMVDGPQGDLVAENHVSRFNVALQTSPASRGNIFTRNYLSFFTTGVDERTPGSNIFANNQMAQIDR